MLRAACDRGKGIAAEVDGKEVLVKPAASGVQVFDRNSGKMLIDHLYPYGALVSWEPSEYGFEIKTIDGKDVSFSTPSGAMLCDAISDRKKGNTASSAKAAEPKMVGQKEGGTGVAEKTIDETPLNSSAADADSAELDMDLDLDALAAEFELPDDPEDIEIAAALAAEVTVDADRHASRSDTLNDLNDMMAELTQGSGDDDGSPETDDLDAMMAELG